MWLARLVLAPDLPVLDASLEIDVPAGSATLHRFTEAFVDFEAVDDRQHCINCSTLGCCMLRVLGFRKSWGAATVCG